MHPSSEDHPGTPDRCFALLDDGVPSARSGLGERAGPGRRRAFDVLLLNHLTPLNEAAGRVAPGIPIVGHLHGTELMALEQIGEGPAAHWTRRWLGAGDAALGSAVHPDRRADPG